jgi:hypothetical protein
MLVNLTNDAWFGKSSAAYQHFSMAVFRAVENRRSLVRCANTGISGFVDPAGRIIARTALFEDAVVDRPVPVLSEKLSTPGMGDLLPLVCLIILGMLMGRSMIRDRQGNLAPCALSARWIKQFLNRMAEKAPAKNDFIFCLSFGRLLRYIHRSNGAGEFSVSGAIVSNNFLGGDKS